MVAWSNILYCLNFNEFKDRIQCLSYVLFQAVLAGVQGLPDFFQIYHIAHHSLPDGSQAFLLKGTAELLVPNVE
jgi:hypothetical protein